MTTNYWLVKQEPTSYSFDTLEKEGTTVWDGVHNNLALKHINSMKKGDLAFFYHSGDEKQIVGILEVTSGPYPNPKEKNKRFVVVDVKHKKRLKRPVTLAEIKKEKKIQRLGAIANIATVCNAGTKRNLGQNTSKVSSFLRQAVY